MRLRPLIWSWAGLLIVAGIWYFWPAANHPAARKKIIMASSVVSVHSASTAPKLFAAKTISTNLLKTAPGKTNQFANRLSNTPKTIGELERDRHAILLENAFLDTSRPLNLSIPKNLQSPGDPGAYIVQARGPIDTMFRALLAAAGARIVSYIPNDAYLVEISAGGAAGLTGNSLVAAVIPYEPYYKLSASLLAGALNGQSLPAGTMLKVQLYSDTPAAAIPQIVPPGGKIVSAEQTPIGWIVTLTPGQNWLAIPQSPLVENVEPVYKRGLANDLSRVTMGISTDTVTPTNYMNLYGSNVLVEVNDSGIDATHPDFSVTGSAEAPGTVPPSRIFGDSALSLVDTNGHGTFVAGIIAGNGSMSLNPVNVGAEAQGSVSNADFRGKAPWADLYSVAFLDVNGNSYDIPDSYLQETPALTNALISNNSWTYVDDDAYDLAAASYDAAVRDALPGVTGSQPVLFVFAAGNDGDGDDDGGGGDPDTINSPATAKNVITVGALEQFRNITNSVTNLDGSVGTPWQPMTDTSSQVAGYSSRGNVGIGTEGAYGRFKPDVVAPGSFVVSDRSSEWDEQAYYNPTNYYFQEFDDQVINANSMQNESVSLNFSPPNTTFNSNVVAIDIQILPNVNSPTPFPSLSIYVSDINYPDPTDPATYDFVTTNNEVSIPNLNDGSSYLSSIQNGNLFLTIVNTNNESVNYDFTTEITTTNESGNYYTVLSNLNDTLGPYYRYESGTSMSAPAVSGMLALMQDYFTNTLHTTPSPALLKAMLINGARLTGDYTYAITNDINTEGWGLVNLPDSLPPGITNMTNVACSSFFLDQNPTNALATGDSHTFLVTINTNAFADYLPLQATLAWTDPPGNPAAAIKLVNNLDLVITNLDTGEVYFGNDMGANGTFNSPSDTNFPPNLDFINNVENIIIPPLLGGHYSVTVIGREVNVNAITAQTNNITGAYAPNIVQDFALVVACGEGEVTNAFTVADEGINSLPTSDQQITDVTSTNNSPLLNQFVGASSPLLGTNTISYGTNAQITIGMTNQWHFYVVTNSPSNSSDVTNAAFITFDAETLSIPRMGVFADNVTNATRPEADIDLYVAGPNDPNAASLTNLDPTVISNCVYGLNGDGASLSRGGTEYVTFTNSSPGDVYYVGVQSEDQMASEYGFVPIFTATPFSILGPNGEQIVNGLALPINIPDGSPAQPGTANVFGIALYPMDVDHVIVTNVIAHQNFGDLIGTLVHNGIDDVLNNHDSYFNDLGIYTSIYDDSPNPVAGSQPSDGPGSLNNFTGTSGAGPWILTEVDDALTHTGSVQNFTLLLEPHQNASTGFTISLQPGTWYYDYIDVPAGATNFTINATNTSVSPPPDPFNPLQLYVKYGSEPSATNYDEMVTLTNGAPFPGNSITIGPPLISGRYYYAVYNPSLNVQTFYVQATLGLGTAPGQIIFSSSGPVPILDDAVTTNSIFVTQDKTISSVDVALRVDHPRVSDLVFHLISPDGTRVLLVENRGGDTTNGMGATLTVSNTVAQPQTSSGDGLASTNIINPGEASGTLTIQYNFYSIPDEMVIYDADGNIIFDSGSGANEVSGSGVFTVTYTNAPLTIVMNPSSNGGEGDLWDYTVAATGPEYEYLVLTENTNLTTTPIKFAIPPFFSVPTTNVTTTWSSSFEGTSSNTLPMAGDYFPEGWYVDSGSVDVLTNGTFGSQSYNGTNFIDINGNDPGTISTNVATVPGQTYVISFAYTQNPDGPDHGSPTVAVQLLENSNVLVNLTLNITTNSWTNLGWATTSVVFTATSPTTQIEFASQTSGSYGVLLNAISLTSSNVSGGDIYYLPEQSLDTYAGENADGTWQLEIQDDRAGATNPAPALLSWQLRFNFTTTTSSVGTLTNGVPQTNTIPANSIAYYLINVPVNAEFATNWLFTTNGPLNLIFNSTAPPGGTNGPGDYLLFTTSTNDSAVLGTNSSPPNIVPGGSYYLGVQNTNSFAVNYGIEVDFDLLPVTITNSTPVTNNIPTNSITEIIVAVPTNAIYASNILISATGPINVYFNQTNPATGDTNAGDFLMLSATNDGSFLLNSASAPPLVPGADYYIGLQNLGTNPVSAVFQVIFGFATPPATNSATNLISISSIIYTNMGGTNGFLLTWFAPSNDLFQVQWTTNLAPVNWNTFTNIISYNPNVAVNPTNTQFNFFDDGSQDGGFGPMRFYRLLLLSATNTLILPGQTNYTANVGIPLTITNTAADSNTNLILTYSLTTSPATSTPAAIDTNGIITWTPGSGDSGGAFQFTTVVTDSGLPPLSATNNFTVFVLPAPAISSAIVTTTNVTLQWTAPTNDLFQVEWTTNLVPVVNWTPFSTVIASTNGDFTFTDTNAPLAMKFYRLLWLP